MTVKLARIVEVLEIQSEECMSYLNKATEEIITLMPDSNNEQEEILSAIGTKYLPLPTKYEVHEYKIIEDFVDALNDPVVAENLAEAIRGKGAFARFKASLAEWNLEKRWYNFRDKALKEIAVQWCMENAVVYKG